MAQADGSGAGGIGADGSGGGGVGAPARGRFGLDLVFGLAFQAVGRGLGGFALLFLISFVLFAAIAAVAAGSWFLAIGPESGPAADPAGNPWFWLIGLALLIAYVVLITLIHLATVALAYAVLRHDRMPLRRLFGLARSRFWPALGAFILAALSTIGGFILFIVPGLILLVRWWVWAPACLIEGCGAGASLRRSAGLTKGVRWTIFWLWLITFLVSGALNQVAQSLTDLHYGFAVLSVAIYGFTSLFWSCLVAAVYVALRDREGGAAPPDLIAAHS